MPPFTIRRVWLGNAVFRMCSLMGVTRRRPELTSGGRAVVQTRRLCVAALVLLTVGGCESTSHRAGVGPTATPAPLGLAPPDQAASAAIVQPEYHIGPLDTLDISVFQVDNLKQTLQVDANGLIEFPLIGSIKASTKTTHELAGDIAAKLGERYLQSPRVIVTVRQSVSQKFTVEGAVRSPGVFPIVGRMTLLQAIATAQGVDSLGNLRGVVVFRTINQKRMAAMVDLAEIRTGKVGDPEIYAGDTIVVSVSGSRRALQNLIGVTPLFIFLTPFGL
jgi:polysaccharide export outer membrane protein